MTRIPRLLLATIVVLATSCSRDEKRTDSFPGAPVIIISVDTLRADRLPAYGYGGVETPAIDALRSDSVLFTNAYTHVPMTLPAHVSILTGQLPYEHAVRNNLGYSFDAKTHPTLPAALKASGYETGAAVSAYVLRGATGLAAAFDVYDDVVPMRSNVSVGELARDGDATRQVAEGWIGQRPEGRFFYLFHIFEPHAPYEPVEPFRSRYASAPYDGEVAASDAIVGKFLEFLKARGIYDRAIIVFLSDHGEGLGDHGEGEHGVFLYREAIRVPLMLKLPGGVRRGETIDPPVQLIDIFPTITQFVGAKAPSTGGRSLLASDTTPRRIYSETMLPRIHFGWSELRSLVDARHHAIDAPRPELYDVVDDPGETKNLRAEQRRIFAAMKEELDGLPSEMTAAATVDPEEAARLAALGYVGSMRSDGGGSAIDPKDGIVDLEEMKRASAIERGGDIPAAIGIYRSILDRNPRFVDAWLRLAASHERLGAVGEAEAAYRRAIEAAPSLASGIALSLGNLQLRSGKYRDALAHAELALSRSPSAAHLLMARIALAQGQVPRAVSEARTAMEDSLRRAEATIVLARALGASGRISDALKLLDSPTDPPTREFHATRADLLARSGRVAEAAREFEAEIAAFPDNRDASARLAILLATQERADDAESVLERMYAANPGAASAQLAARTWGILGQNARAARWQRRMTQR
ncbi:MAG: sulfatase-like hydrolase/transferase [Thermoanaerobaculia bacterium]